MIENNENNEATENEETVSETAEVSEAAAAETSEVSEATAAETAEENTGEATEAQAETAHAAEDTQAEDTEVDDFTEPADEEGAASDAASDDASDDAADTAAEDTNTAEESAETDNTGEEASESEEPKGPGFFKRHSKKIIITAAAVIGVAAVIYFSGVLFYSNHFFWGTELGGVNCSNMSVEAAEQAILDDVANYTFTFYERDGAEETISGSDIYLECQNVGDLDEAMEKQNPLEWATDRSSRTLPLDIEVTYNPDSLYNRMSEMQFMAETRANMEGSTSKVQYVDGEFTVVDDSDDGATIVSLNELFEKVKPKISELYRGMNMEQEACYTDLAGEDTMKGVLNLLNKYNSTVVTYLNGENTTVLDGSTIHEWLSVGDDYSVNIDTEQARAYIDELAKSYDTVGKARKFTTTGGSQIEISGGSYGWLVNNQAETEALLENIRNGETIEKEPVYKQKAGDHGSNNDLPNTYVEVSISAQHMWYYKNGEQLISSDCVTGNPLRNTPTHTGIYYVLYKDRNAVLRGPGYASPVSYWMPFNGGEGLHDAPWRGSFGGSIYRGGGSHGCVNLPTSTAAKLFEVVSAGDPVVVY